MSDDVRRPRHESTLRAEISDVLNVFSKAATAEDIAFAIVDRCATLRVHEVLCMLPQLMELMSTVQ